MAEKKKVFVKTVYGPTSLREPDITGYHSKKDAEMMVRACLRWGIDIVSCEIIKD